jgi:molybdenum cofactor guanylyltransferase
MAVFTGVVLLGGASRRYGSDKAFALHDGQPMGQRMIDTLVRAGADPLMTVGGSDRGFGLPHVKDQYPGEGPLGGLLSAFSHVTTDLLVALACDLPFLQPASILRLVDTAVAEPEMAAVVAFSDRLEPLCACYRLAECWPSAQHLFDSGERSLMEFLKSIKVRSVLLPDRNELRNVNRAEDHLS